MIDHGHALTLAATAIDFPLDASERASLDAHLRDCTSCRADLAAVREDAARLAALPGIRPPGWVRKAIGRTHRPSRIVLLAAAALLVTASIAAALLVGAPHREARNPNATPSATGLASLPSSVPSSAPLDPAAASWTSIGTGAGGQLVGFGGGYVALASGELEAPVAWFSNEGRDWTSTTLSSLVPNCPGFGAPGSSAPVPDADGAAIATNGRQVVVVGAEHPNDPASCSDGGSIRPIAWISDNGRTWRRSAPFYTGGPNGRATAVWAMPDGWEAVADDPGAGTLAVWHSADGLTWESIGPLAGPTESAEVFAVAAAGGTVIVSRATGIVGTGGVHLLMSSDSRTWSPIDKAGGCETGATQIVAPATPGLNAWVVVSGTRICTSVNLTDWSTKELPISVWRVAQTRFGLIADGDTCFGAGTNCPDPGPRAYLTVDGVTWSPLAHPKAYYGRALADGPAGVLLIGDGPDASGGLVSGVWVLEP
jgi:hypothetical protein